MPAADFFARSDGPPPSVAGAPPGAEPRLGFGVFFRAIPGFDIDASSTFPEASPSIAVSHGMRWTVRPPERAAFSYSGS